ncbi:SDR family NAD(P)-dependent oxidoreductase [Moorena sp. SIO3H5]|uniref:SDR family NAD(P)-dependent oxidoreductase n=1 Tax=Moorena sp. SIO3H5 TaxID=2607834 RepID=UPI0013B6959A|nr:SDR family NAD(P)-dependent oxidoreductase [Moorena sp. SIO3H5]NEO70086.1 SDR family NAD(P)-dependent oxidoreductase [Moorena sp. SIO3H5]
MNQSKHQPVCIVTGGNSGVGLMTALGLAQLGHHVFIACRCANKAEKAVKYIRSSTGNVNVEFLPLDLASLDSVRTFVKLFKERNLPLNILVNNAGVFNTRGITKEGFELIFGINYLGHFLLTNLLIETLKKSGSSRIIMVSSDLALRPTSIKWESFVKKTPFNFMELYALSKLCLLVLTQELTRRLENTNVTVNSIHPGFVHSNITWMHRLSKYLGLGISPQESALGLVTFATSSTLAGVKGKFFDYKQNEIKLPELVKDTNVAQELWKRSCLWTGYNRDKSTKTQNNNDAAGVLQPYALAMTPTEVGSLTKTIIEDVLPKPPIKSIFDQALKFLFKLKISSLLLLLSEILKKQFYMERHLDSEAVWSICQDDTLIQKLKEYLGENLVLWRSEIWVNYPSQQLIPFWHQDSYPNLLQGEGKSINVYIALTEVNEWNGFEYIPTNRQLTQDVLVKMKDPSTGNSFFKLTEDLEKQAVPVVLSPGEFVLFTDQLMHRSLRNTSGQVRVALALRVIQPSIEVLQKHSPIDHKPVLL